ncbi:MAG: TonB-dependent receptor [Gemmatimonadaceae bacterium]|nr:TonB-dependent receptor [Gemmatimonadaceae bacterium]
MITLRWRTFAAAAVTTLLTASLAAQGVTTGAIAGLVTGPDGAPLASAQVQITNATTGFSTGAITGGNGRYYIQSLEVGAGYRVVVRRIGFKPQARENLTVALSQTRREDFKMESSPVEIAAVTVTATNDGFGSTNTGAKNTVSDTLLQRIPVTSRNLTEFIKLSPQVSTSGPGYSAGGMSNRMNNVQIDGATERDIFGLGSTGQPGGQIGAKAISIDAVKELQVLLTPFDVRQGNFGGLLLNAVTKSGTNDLRGSAFGFYRDQSYSRNVPATRATALKRSIYGFTLGGPIIKDKLHFFIAPEIEREDTPFGGPFRGQPANFPVPQQVAVADLDRYESIMKTQYSRTDIGTAAAVSQPRPQNNFFGRLDWRISDAHRAVLRLNYTDAMRENRDQQSRTTSRMIYSDNLHELSSKKLAPVLQLFSNFKNGASNEFFLGYNRVRDRRVPNTLFPQITVTVPRVGGGNATIVGGADQFSQGNEGDFDAFELTNNFTKNMGEHTWTLGTRHEYMSIRNQFTQSSYGVWGFRSLDSLQAGNANSFRKAVILRDAGNVNVKALQSAFYAQDLWQATPRLALTLGLRADITSYLNSPVYNRAIDSAYQRRTDDIPGRVLQWSPRVGFNWDATGDSRNQVRGGAGLFVGTPPYVWIANAYGNSGNIITFLNCNTSGSTAPAPAFTTNVSGISSCRNGAGTSPIGDVNFMSGNLKFPQPLRATMAYDRRLAQNYIFTVEGLWSTNLNQLFFVNRNLKGARGLDSRGRVLFGDTIRAATGVAVPVVPDAVIANGGTARFSTAIDMLNQNRDYAYNVTAQIKKQYSDNWEGMVAYTYGRARDVQSFTSSTAISNWQFGRTLSGDQFLADPTTSLFDQPHKFVVTGTYTAWWWKKKLSTDFNIFWSGFSGSPHDYVYGAGPSGGSGDLNADGRQGNDLIYVPKSAFDTNEIRFVASGTITVAQQQQAFEDFIKNSSCLRGQRGQIMKRNSCRNPFQQEATVSIRQSLPELLGGQRAMLEVQLFNPINFINREWGRNGQTDGTTNSNVNILSHQRMTSSDPKSAVPIFTYNITQTQYIRGNSAFDYWRYQVAFRYSF